MSFKTFNHSIVHTIQSHIYMAQFPLFFSPLASPPFAPPLCPLLLTWHPPAVTGIVHLGLRLLVNWPHLPHPSPNYPTPSKFPSPNCLAPNNDDLGNIPALAIRNTKVFQERPKRQWKKFGYFLQMAYQNHRKGAQKNSFRYKHGPM
jgi:hypothetical protein